MSSDALDLAQISELVHRWVDGSISSLEIDSLVRVAGLIARRRLGGELCSAARVEGTDPATLAISLLNSVFGEPPGPQSQIGRSWRNNPPQDTPPGVVSWLESIVFVTGVRRLARRDIDGYRARSRVRRRIREAVRASSLLIGFPSDRLEYVQRRNLTEGNHNKQLVSLDDVQRAVERSWQPDSSDVENFEAVVNLLTELPNRSGLIPFSLLCQAVLIREQEVDRTDWELRSQRHDRDPAFELKLERSIAESLAAVDPVLNGYCQRGRQTPQQCGWMRQGAGQFLKLTAIGQEPVQHECLAEFWPGLTRDQYRQDQSIRERFEYVVKVAWKRFVDQWRAKEE